MGKTSIHQFTWPKQEVISHFIVADQVSVALVGISYRIILHLWSLPRSLVNISELVHHSSEEWKERLLVFFESTRFWTHYYTSHTVQIRYCRAYYFFAMPHVTQRSGFGSFQTSLFPSASIIRSLEVLWASSILLQNEKTKLGGSPHMRTCQQIIHKYRVVGCERLVWRTMR